MHAFDAIDHMERDIKECLSRDATVSLFRVTDVLTLLLLAKYLMNSIEEKKPNDTRDDCDGLNPVF